MPPNAAYDRSLLGALKSIDASISTDSGGLSVEVPYRMLEFFELTARGRAHYPVVTEDRLVEIGNADLPRAPTPLTTGSRTSPTPRSPARRCAVASYARVLERPIAGATAPQRVVIQTAEPLTSRTQFTRRLAAQALSRDVVLIAVACVLLPLGIGWALRPLARLRAEVSARRPDDFEPINRAQLHSQCPISAPRIPRLYCIAAHDALLEVNSHGTHHRARGTRPALDRAVQRPPAARSAREGRVECPGSHRDEPRQHPPRHSTVHDR